MSLCVVFEQILAVHLLQAVLPSWDKTERARDMKCLVEKLFGFLGSLLTTCSSDVPLLRGEWRCLSLVPLFSECCATWFSLCFRIHIEEAEGAAAGFLDCHSQQHSG